MKDEYAKVGVPMLPVVRGERETRRQILLYTLLLYAVTQLPFCAGGFGAVYLAASMALGAGFIAGAVTLYRRADRRSALRLYCTRPLPGAAVRRHGPRRTALGGIARMDRNLARKNVRTGLIVGALSLLMFGLSFLAAAVYVS